MDAAPRDNGPSAAAGVTMIVLTLLGWASVPLFLRHFVSAMDAWTSNGWRYGFAALLWAPVAYATLRTASPARGIWKASLFPALVNSIGQVFFTWAHYRISPGLLSFGLRTQIVFVAAGAYLFFPSERRVVRAPLFWAGVVLVLTGTAGTILFGMDGGPQVSVSGVCMALLAGFFFAGYGLAVRRFMAAYPSVPSFAVISQYTALAMVVLMLLLGDEQGASVLRLSGSEVTLLLVSAVIGIALGHVFYYMSIKRLGVAASSGVLQLQPILVGIGAAFLFGELLTPQQWASGALAIAGAVAILLVQRDTGGVVINARRQLAGR